jgi:RND superfamily putative drug exporter
VSTLLSTIGRWSFLHPWRVLLAWLLVAGLVGGGALALNSGTDDAFSIPGTESQAGIEQLARSFPQVSGTSARILVIAPEGQSVTESAFREAIDDLVDELAGLEGVLAAQSPYDELISGMINDTERAAIVQVQFEGQATSVTKLRMPSARSSHPSTMHFPMAPSPHSVANYSPCRFQDLRSPRLSGS